MYLDHYIYMSSVCLQPNNTVQSPVAPCSVVEDVSSCAELATLPGDSKIAIYSTVIIGSSEERTAVTGFMSGLVPAPVFVRHHRPTMAVGGGLLKRIFI